jgi:geranylgeranyl pyrophosphate synthase
MNSSVKEISIQEFIKSKKQLIEDYLDQALLYSFDNKKNREASSANASKLWSAMRYSSLDGGKRIRGVLCLAVFEAIKLNSSLITNSDLANVDFDQVLPLASGIEAIHAMSLIHDDLPCMDDDSLRRGKPTCHIAYDEATALLAGDALLVEGINLCLKANLNPASKIRIIEELTNAIGARGMTGGQMIDLEQTANEEASLEELEIMHSMKTGALLRASVIIGAIAAEANNEQVKALSEYATKIGLAFQIADDVLDQESNSELLGKTACKDLAQNKTTYPKLLGLEESKAKAKELVQQAKKALLKSNINFEPLFSLADYIIERQY